MITFFRLSDLASLWPKTGATHCHARGIGLSDKRRTIRGLNISAIVIILVPWDLLSTSLRYLSISICFVFKDDVILV